MDLPKFVLADNTDFPDNAGEFYEREITRFAEDE